MSYRNTGAAYQSPLSPFLPLRKKAPPKGRTVDRGRSGKESGHNIADRLVVVVVYDTITPIRRDQQKVRVRGGEGWGWMLMIEEWRDGVVGGWLTGGGWLVVGGMRRDTIRNRHGDWAWVCVRVRVCEFEKRHRADIMTLSH
jgi:hypothetical protein